MPTLSAVWPPIEMTIESGLSRLMTCSTKSGVTGRKNTLSARWSALLSSPPCVTSERADAVGADED